MTGAHPIITIRTAGGILAQGQTLLPVGADGCPQADANGMVWVRDGARTHGGKWIPAQRQVPAPHPLSQQLREDREDLPPSGGRID